jgi:hypothetical protein
VLGGTLPRLVVESEAAAVLHPMAQVSPQSEAICGIVKIDVLLSRIT